MSAILKALRKIEQESSGQVRDPSISRKLDAKRALNQQAKKSWLLRRAVTALSLVLVLAASIVLGFVYGPSLLKGGPSSSTLSDPPRDWEKEETLSAPQPSGQDAGTLPQIAQGPLTKKTAQRAAEPPSQAPPVLELQAIVWSEDPESRFAVINGNIVRTNGMVEGVSVTEISHDAVSFKQGEKAWKLKMLEGD